MAKPKIIIKADSNPQGGTSTQRGRRWRVWCTPLVIGECDVVDVVVPKENGRPLEVYLCFLGSISPFGQNPIRFANDGQTPPCQVTGYGTVNDTYRFIVYIPIKDDFADANSPPMIIVDDGGGGGSVETALECWELPPPYGDVDIEKLRELLHTPIFDLDYLRLTNPDPGDPDWEE